MAELSRMTRPAADQSELPGVHPEEVIISVTGLLLLRSAHTVRKGREQIETAEHTKKISHRFGS